MPRARRLRGGLASPVIAALIAAMPDPGNVWPVTERAKWISAFQAAMHLAYRGVATPMAAQHHPADSVDVEENI
jgi:hypothetical protein